MTNEELLKKLLENTVDLILNLEKDGADFSSSAKELDIARYMVKERFSLSEDQINSVEFVYWISFWAEKELHKDILEIETNLGARSVAMESVLNKLHFGDKIKVMKEIYISDTKKDPYLEIYNKINNLRNAVAHGRYEELKYGGYELHEFKGQLKLLSDFRNAALTKTNHSDSF